MDKGETPDWNALSTDEQGLAVKEVLKGEPAIIDLQPYVARLIRARFLALIDEGFTKGEALTLLQGFTAS